MHRCRARRPRCYRRQQRGGMLVRALGYSGLGFFALMSSLVNRAAKENLTNGLRPRTGISSGSLACCVRSLARQLQPRGGGSNYFSQTLIRSMRGRMFFGGSTVSAKAGLDSNRNSNTKSHSYDHLFRRPEKGEYTKIQGTALIVLNTPIDPTIEWHLGNIWHRADVIVCADGASNRLYRLSHSEGEMKDAAAKKEKSYVPHAVCGDLDSISPNVVDYYRDKGVEILRVEDEGSNDLEKSLRIVKERYGATRAILCGGLGGRFDHEMGNINALLRNLDEFDQIVMLGSSSLVQILGSGQHRINVDRQHLGPHCGLIPVLKPARVETTGLKWNLKGETLQMGGLVSTSNVLTADSVIIKTTAPLIWTTSITASQDGSASSEMAAGRTEALTVD